jgi:hypothetical protein
MCLVGAFLPYPVLGADQPDGRHQPDPRLCAAIVDRLTFGGHIVETGTQSYRLAHTLANRTG